MNEPNLQAQQPVMTAQIQIKRAATGKVEDWTLTFTPTTEQPEPKPEDKQCP
jgi:hypothetical protein